MLRINNLSVSYGPVAALRGIDLTVEAGETVALVGSNGAGKSTTLKAISGLVPPSGGTIEFLGETLNGLKPEAIVERGIVHVPEGRRIFPRLSVEQNLEVGAYSARAAMRRRRIREEVYALFPRLRERRQQMGGSLSGGEQQMLAFGRAMMAQPTLLLLDEPSLGLAPIIVEEVIRAIAHFRAEGVTILLVEQNAELALTLSARGYVLETGQVVLTDESQTLITHPKVWASYLGEKELEDT
ncbi:ABC transporter ATP-binding protein [Aquabacter spiritensis]|uniref:Amino acid/amide ABC transporter ATP-binding protein 2 (HAAT family) n=1 Tax=Aquabacter spiritensis TaxID=933073 RepID=A0A4R3LXV9_9HYPH|nr:ABC transporter ATP-binding protein [Aquabacter spiritensis]TCT05504.1 amino acid/amide ABC transporter ATP-binding protein 2 (HAAT family) [Aquabacter spiritensis]